MSDAYLLVSHGSRDPRPQQAIEFLARQLRESLPAASSIATAQLELAAQPLHVQIADFARQCAQQGIDRIVILPLFLIPGIHVMEDIPAQVALAEGAIGNDVKLTTLSFLGDAADFADLFVRNRSDLPDRSIILSHGSRRAGGNQIVESLSDRLNLPAAYWSVAPSLADSPRATLRERVAEAIETDATEIGILPYFLFAGGITDAIAAAVAQLQQQYPQAKLILAAPIGERPELVETIAKILIDS